MRFPQTDRTEHAFIVVLLHTFDVDLMYFLLVYVWNYFAQENSASYVIT